MRAAWHNRSFLAHDVYSRWKRLISAAKESITIYTPFFDQLLLSLLKSNKKLFHDNTIIVTDFNADSVLDMPRQLMTIKKLLSTGISVLHLPGLHAKVLLTDDKHVSVGSQNFTGRGRRNKEASSVPALSLEGSRFIETLISWRQHAEDVEEELVDLLLSKISSHHKRHMKLHEDWALDFEEMRRTCDRAKQQAEKLRLAKLERQSRIRLADGAVFACVQEIPSAYGGYMSLKADANRDMTNWVFKRSRKPYSLNRLSMYPVLFMDTLRMGFARIAKTRITYIRNNVKWRNRSFVVSDLALDVDITLPTTRTRQRNIKVILSGHYRGSCEFALLFNGDSVRCVRKRYFKSSRHWQKEHRLFRKTLETLFFASQAAMENFIRRFFTDFSYEELGIEHKNIRDYCKGWRYSVRVVEYQRRGCQVFS